MKTHDSFPVETVFIPTENRDTICFSSQSGCPLKCDFCLTAKLGLLRNLTAGEIVEQIIIVLNDVYGVGAETPHGTNLVAMGAGEPFLNFENLMKALEIMAKKTDFLSCRTALRFRPSESCRKSTNLPNSKNVRIWRFLFPRRMTNCETN